MGEVSQAASARRSQTGTATPGLEWNGWAALYARVALGAAFLSAVASRFGLWDRTFDLKHFAGFVHYTAQVLSFVPLGFVPTLAWSATAAETILGLLLIAGLWQRQVAIASAVLLAMFGTAMGISFGIRSPMDYSVFSASSAAVLLSLRTHGHSGGRTLMKSRNVAISIVVMFLLASASIVTPHAQAQQSDDALLQVRESVWRAWFTNDVKTLHALVPPETIVISGGERKWKHQSEVFRSAAEFQAAGDKLIRLEFPHTEIQHFGRVAMVWSDYLVEIESRGKRAISTGRATEIFVRRNGQWVNPGWHTDSTNNRN